MLILFLPLLLARLGSAGFASDADCENNRCLVLVNCTSVQGVEVGRVFGSLDDRDYSICPEVSPRTLQMVVEIDTRSARLFDGRVFYREPLTEINILGRIYFHSDSVIYEFKELPLTDRSPPRGGNGRLADLSSYRFTIEAGPDKNLFHLFAQAVQLVFKLPKAAEGTPFDNKAIFDAFSENFRCDPSDLVDHCATSAAFGEACEELNIAPTTLGSCSRKLWFANDEDDSWSVVKGVRCDEGNWKVITDDLESNFASARFFCAQRRPVCAQGPSALVLTILLGIYCAISTLVIVALFVVLNHKMNLLRGTSKFKVVRIKGTRERQSSLPSTPSTGSGKEDDGPKQKLLTPPATGNLNAPRPDPPKKATQPEDAYQPIPSGSGKEDDGPKQKLLPPPTATGNLNAKGADPPKKATQPEDEYLQIPSQTDFDRLKTE